MKSMPALDALTGTPCVNCTEPLEFHPDSSRCDECFWLYCPVCGQDVAGTSDDCPHALAWWDVEGECLSESPFEGLELTGLKGDWSSKQKREAFGDLLPLMDAYEDDLSEFFYDHDLFLAILKLIDVPVIVFTYEHGYGGGLDYFTTDPDEAHSAFGAVVARLRAGFAQLAAFGPPPVQAPVQAAVRAAVRA